MGFNTINISRGKYLWQNIKVLLLTYLQDSRQILIPTPMNNRTISSLLKLIGNKFDNILNTEHINHHIFDEEIKTQVSR